MIPDRRNPISGNVNHFNLPGIGTGADPRMFRSTVHVRHLIVKDGTLEMDDSILMSRRKGSVMVAGPPTILSEIGSALQGSQILRTIWWRKWDTHLNMPTRSLRNYWPFMFPANRQKVCLSLTPNMRLSAIMNCKLNQEYRTRNNSPKLRRRTYNLARLYTSLMRRILSSRKSGTRTLKHRSTYCMYRAKNCALTKLTDPRFIS